MATAPEILAELEALGTEQTRKTNRRHGIGENQFGVLYSAFEKLRKRIKTDHALALELWESGIYDARIFALMIADPKQATPDLIDHWTSILDNYAISDAVSTFVAKTAFAREKAEQWIESDDEWIATAGWNLIGSLTHDPTLPDSYFLPYLTRIARDLHGSQNRVRYAMNNAVIAIGVRNDALEPQAVAAATQIGTVYVDHGQTNCKTPEAVTYIAKTRDYQRQKAEKQKA